MFSEGPYSHLEFSLLDSVITDTNGNAGFTFRSYLEPPENTSRKEIDTMFVKTTKFFLTDYSPPQLTSSLFWAEMEACLTPDKSGLWDFGICTQGTARLFLDDVEIIDNATHQEPGNAFLGAGTKEVFGTVNLQAGKKYKLLISFGSAPTSKLVAPGIVTFRKGGVRLRGGPKINVENAINEACEVAKKADQVVLVVGLNVSISLANSHIQAYIYLQGDWEVEGQDRADMCLPRHTDELITSVLKVRPDAVVVTQSGTPVAMPWADQAQAMVQMWYGGNEGGNGLADVLFGDVNPVSKIFMCSAAQNTNVEPTKRYAGIAIMPASILVGLSGGVCSEWVFSLIIHANNFYRVASCPYPSPNEFKTAQHTFIQNRTGAAYCMAKTFLLDIGIMRRLNCQ